VERLQLTWLIWAVALFAVLNSQRWITGNGPILFLVTLPLVPAAAAVAILRYDLFDIRVIVNRTLVYGLLTALLGLGYAGGVLVLGQLAGRDRNNLAMAGTTLAAPGARPGHADRRALCGGRRDHGAEVGLAVAAAAGGTDLTTWPYAAGGISARSRSRLASPSSIRRVKRRRAAT
jgi:two-component system, NarL family, sensor kinase